MISKNGPSTVAARRLFVALSCVLAAALLPSWASAQEAAFKLFTKKGVYSDIRFDVHNAIIGRGLVVDFNGQVSKMLERTGKEVGSDKPIYTEAEYFTFCSAKLSRAMMEADPSNMGFCPYVIFLYEAADAPGTVHVGYRRLQRDGPQATKVALGEIERLLEGIIAEALK